ncbi:MAG TPA: hypothetical protein VF906_05660 [Candidatus Bathyarchaeia archaeon]
MTLALIKVWSPRPISLSIVEVLERKGAMTDIDLQKELKSNFGEVSFRELNTNLMRLEMAGVLWVTRLMKGKRQVELTGKPDID